MSQLRPDSTELTQRLRWASAQMERGEDDAALEELAWLWAHALEISESWVGVRSSHLIEVAKPLVERSPKARERFAHFRDQSATTLSDRSSFDDWVNLSCLLGQEQQILQWLSTVTETAALAVGVHRNHQILELLENHSEWAILGRLLRDPVDLLRGEYEQISNTLARVPAWFSPADTQETHAKLQEILRKRAAAFYHSLTAANRLYDAQLLFDEASRLDPSPEMKDGLERVRARRS